MELPKQYAFKESEEKWMQWWEKEGIFTFKKDDTKKLFSIDTPPPTVSGNMHIGHASSYSHDDFIARYRRMNGHNVFFPFGTDDNGLPTEKLVEKTKKVRSTKMAPKEFRDLCYQTVKDLKKEFVEGWKRIGMSYDFTKSYSTIDPESQKMSQAMFIDLHEKGLVRREETPVAWDTYFQTSIAQAEFENIEVKSHFNDIIFKSKGKELIIATTRPELLPACVALFFHPDDERYKELEGHFATVPLFDYEVPIMADASVDKEKGTGLMMVCTFGDKEDIEKFHKYRLGLRVAITKDGKLNQLAGAYEGLPLLEARKKIIADLQEKKLLIRQQAIKHNVNVYEKSGREVEFLVANQWFVDIIEHKQELIDLGNKINWYPEHMKVRYEHWIQNLNWDWGISRQRSFGVPFPVWYEKDTGKIILADKEQLPVDPSIDTPNSYTGDKDNLVPELDVMDTWATSSLSPLIALERYGLGTDGNIPMSLRQQAHDIIRTWAFYTIVRHYYGFKKVPWETIMISGFVTDQHGKKMSKSKGNVVDPFIMLDAYGADVLRFWAAGGKLGDDIPFVEKDLITGKKTLTKLWNSSRFALGHLEGYVPKETPLTQLDQFILGKLSVTIKEATEAFEQYEYGKAMHVSYNFFWQIFCDQYLELVKDRVYNPDNYEPSAVESAKYTLYTIMFQQLKLFAPIMPFITEELYQAYFKQFEKTKSIHLCNWPEARTVPYDHIMKGGNWLLGIVSAVRKYKSEKQLSLKTPLKEISIETPDALFLEPLLKDLQMVTGAEKVSFGEGDIVISEHCKITIKQ